jgi:hypothetical protein
MFETDPQEVQDALRLLKITGRPDKPTVIRAFRDAAKEVHPDKFRTEAEKAAAHPKFLKLVAARDLCLQALDEQVGGGGQTAAPSGASTARPPRERPAAQPERPDYRAEWEAFATNQHAYFNAMTAVSSALTVGLQAAGITLFACFIAGGMAVLFALIAALVAGAIFVAGSATVAIPVAGWILGGAAVVGLLKKVGELWEAARESYVSSADSIFRGVAVTGRATVTFHATFWLVIVSFWLVGALMVDSRDGGTVFFGALCIITGCASLLSYLIIFSLIYQRMAELDAAFRRLREAPSFALVLAPRPQRRG